MSGRTGQMNTVSGIYRADHCNKPERAMPQGKVFPPCPNCHSVITWTLVRRTDTNPGK
jgi:hypothetical protein